MKHEPAWLDVLGKTAARLGQPATAKLIGYSTAVVCAVLKGTYTGNLQRVEAAVNGALMGQSVDCPVIGELARNKCLDHQRAAFAATNPQRVQLWLTCPGCTHNLSAGVAGREPSA